MLMSQHLGSGEKHSITYFADITLFFKQFNFFSGLFIKLLVIIQINGFLKLSGFMHTNLTNSMSTKITVSRVLRWNHFRANFAIIRVNFIYWLIKAKNITFRVKLIDRPVNPYFLKRYFLFPTTTTPVDPISTLLIRSCSRSRSRYPTTNNNILWLRPANNTCFITGIFRYQFIHNLIRLKLKVEVCWLGSLHINV